MDTAQQLCLGYREYTAGIVFLADKYGRQWEMAALCSRVRVLLRQNLSGAKAMEELEALRSEIETLLDSVDGDRIDADKWPREH